MHWALSRESKEIVRRFLTRGVLLAFDFDGTLAPIVADPERAKMRPRTRRLLQIASANFPCVVISGRSLANLRRLLAGTGIHAAIGNHGAEPWSGRSDALRQVALWRERLGPALSGLAGVRIENKTYSLTVHYRQCRRKALVRSIILQAAASLSGVRAVSGKDAVSLVSVHAPDKGIALQAEMARSGCGRAIYVGDEETDEDAFAWKDRVPLLTIRVGRKSGSRADYFLWNQREMDDLLRVLISRLGINGSAASPSPG